MRLGLLIFGCAALVACESDEPAGTPPKGEPPPQSCFAPDGLGGSPTDFEALMAHIDALPHPLTLPCLLQSFDRPLAIDATWNTFSLQPAYGPNNPRIFIYKGALSMSVVPKGDARPLLEFGQSPAPGRSIKGEFKFPIEGTLDPAAPFDRILEPAGGSKCAFCHFNEERVDEIDYAVAYVSDIVPISNGQRVDLDYLTWAHSECDRLREADRCAMLDAIFAYGDVVEHVP